MAEPFLTVSEGAQTLTVPFQRKRYISLHVNVTCAYTPGTAVPGTYRLSKTINIINFCLFFFKVKKKH